MAAETIGLKEPPPTTSSDETREGEVHEDNDTTEGLLFGFGSRDWISIDEDSESGSWKAAAKKRFKAEACGSHLTPSTYFDCGNLWTCNESCISMAAEREGFLRGLGAIK